MKEKNLRYAPVVTKGSNKHFADCDEIQFNAKCDCIDRVKAFKGFKIDDIATCAMEATGIYFKRLMFLANFDQTLHCSAGCRDIWKREMN